MIQLSVRDDGKGLGEGGESEAARFGVMGMRERVQALNGELELTSSQGEGLIVRATIPVVGTADEVATSRPVASA